MNTREPILIRRARVVEVDSIRTFGAHVIPAHYAPLIGGDEAQAQLATWWGDEHLRSATEEGRVHLALAGGVLVGMVQYGDWQGTPVIWKLYVGKANRGEGIGRRLIEAVLAELPADTGQLAIEHFAANTAAARFYEREGFGVDHVVPGKRAELDVVWRLRRLR